MRERRFAFEDETIGVISPTYDWGLPSIVKAFLEQAAFQTSYLYFAATYGTTPGAIGAMAKGSDQGPQHRRLLFRPDAGYLDTDF